MERPDPSSILFGYFTLFLFVCFLWKFINKILNKEKIKNNNYKSEINYSTKKFKENITDKYNLKRKEEKQKDEISQKRNKTVSRKSKSNPFSVISSNRNFYSNIIENNFILNNLNLKNEIKLDLKEKLQNQINKKINIIEDNKSDELIIKGNIGELEIFKYLIENVSDSLFIFNSYIEKENESTEIDLIMLHQSGLYVFEIKNFNGWIFGSENDYNWVCTYFNNNKEKEKVIFYNPILKNKNNIEKIQTLLGSKKYPIYNYIILNNNSTLKNKNLNNTDFKILTYSNIDKHFKETDRITKNKISKEELKEIIFKLYPLSKVKNQSV